MKHILRKHTASNPKRWLRLLPQLLVPFIFLLFFTQELCAQLSYNIDDVNGQTLYLPGVEGTITLYDSGGPFGNYQASEDYEVTICSDVELAGCPPIPEINTVFFSFDVEEQTDCLFDHLEIVSEDIYCNTNLPPIWEPFNPIGLENESGCVTVRFHTDDSQEREGFEIEFSADYIITLQTLTCGTSIEEYIGAPVEGCLTCFTEYDCGGDTYGPYSGGGVKYAIETEGPTTLTIAGDIDFFVYGLSTNIGPNGCPPVSSIACAVGNQTTVTFNADDYPYGIWVILETELGSDYQLTIECGAACATCDQCFTFLPRYLSGNTIDFQNRYCGGDVFFQGDESGSRSGGFTYEWSVPDANEQYTSGTNATSENPSIIFPGPGSYTVCQKVYDGISIVFECCHTVFIGPCNVPPVAHFTAVHALFDRFVLNTNGNGNHLQWTFSNPGVSFFQGDEHSSNPVIVIPGKTCVTVCLYETNTCGTSSYCLELCLDEPSCPGSTPPVYINNEIQPIVEDKHVEINLPAPPSGGQATYAWDFGDGTTATTKDIEHTFPEYGNYNVCVVVTVGCRTWCYCWCINLNPCTPIYTYNEGDLDIEFTGSENELQYSITASVPKAAGESWLVNGNAVSGNTNTLIYTFPSAGNYTICFPYLGNNGCVFYYCVDINVGNPFACNSITWQFNATTGYRFSIPVNSTDILWTIDETGQHIGQNATSDWVLPVNPCGWRTISVRYFDGVRYRVCCLRIYLCPPDACFGSIDFGYLSTTNQATFKLNTTGNTDITWYFDDAPGETIGTGASIAIPYPQTCVSRWISVRYKDNAGRWRICCRLIYFCNPFACEIIEVNYNTSNGYSFTSPTLLENMSWIVEETQTPLGSGQTSNYLPVDVNCDYRTISLRYWVPGLGWKLCCVRIYWCNPALCGDQISFSTSNNALVLATTENLHDLSWFKDGTYLGAGNPQATNLSVDSSHTICQRYRDLCESSWKWCCRTYTPGATTDSLIFDFDNKVCGIQNQIVEVPLKVKGFTNMKSFQFSVSLQDSLKGRLLEITAVQINGEFTTVIDNAATGRVLWESPNSTTIPDGSIVAKARIQIIASITGESNINITSNPLPIYAEDANGNQKIPIVRGGTYCFEQLVRLCGKLTREDNVPIPNVVISLNGCKGFTTVTDLNGQYCFEEVPAGSDYVIRATKDTNYKNGVNTGDLSAIKRHLLGIVDFTTPYRILAGDGRKGSGLNTGDISELRRLIQGVLTDLPTCESWEFTDKKFIFPDPDNPFSFAWPQHLFIPNLQLNLLDADMIGWKMGDVTLGNNPQAITGEIEQDSRSATDLYLFLSSTRIPEADTFFVDVSTRQFNDVLNGSFSILFDPEKFELAGISNQHPALNLGSEEFVINATGSMAFAWASSTGVTLPDSSVLFSMMFIPKVAEVQLSEVTFSNEPAEIYFENENGEILNVITSDGEINVPVEALLPEQVSISPNPAGDWVSVRVRLDAPSTVEVVLLNEMGVQMGRLNSLYESTTFFTGRLLMREFHPEYIFSGFQQNGVQLRKK